MGPGSINEEESIIFVLDPSRVCGGSCFVGVALTDERTDGWTRRKTKLPFFYHKKKDDVEYDIFMASQITGNYHKKKIKIHPTTHKKQPRAFHKNINNNTHTSHHKEAIVEYRTPYSRLQQQLLLHVILVFDAATRKKKRKRETPRGGRTTVRTFCVCTETQQRDCLPLRKDFSYFRTNERTHPPHHHLEETTSQFSKQPQPIRII